MPTVFGPFGPTEGCTYPPPGGSGCQQTTWIISCSVTPTNTSDGYMPWNTTLGFVDTQTTRYLCECTNGGSRNEYVSTMSVPVRTSSCQACPW
jgi:hypothetical protein